MNWDKLPCLEVPRWQFDDVEDFLDLSSEENVQKTIDFYTL